MTHDCCADDQTLAETDDCCALDTRESKDTNEVERPVPRRLPCPDCEEAAGRVTAEPVRFYAKEPDRVTAETYYFCETRGCDTVYFDGDSVRFTRDDLTLRFGVKEEIGPRLVCYCFGHTEEAMEAEYRLHQKTTIPERIRAEIAAETCECEFRNPTGKCCLGAVTMAMKRLRLELKGN